MDQDKIKSRLKELAANFRLYSDLLSKKTAVNKTEKRKIIELESEFLAILDPSERSDLIAGVDLVSKFYGVTVRTIQLWAKRGMPKLKHGLYDLKAVNEWWCENIYSGGSPESEAAREVYWKWKAEEKRMDVERKKGALIPDKEIAPMWSARMREVCSGLDAFGSRINPKIEGKNFHEREKIIGDEVWKLKDTYCRAGKFCPVEE